MTSDDCGRQTRVCAQACAVSVVLLTAPGYADNERSTTPSLSTACQVYGAHIGDLIAEHKEAQEISDADLDEAITLFYVGRSYCGLGFHEKAIETYSRITLGRVKQQLPIRPR